MTSILSSAIVAAGKHIIDGFGGGESSGKIDRQAQLERFDRRLDYATDPARASFREFLSANQVKNLGAMEFLADRLKDELASHPEAAAFISANGGRSAPFSIEKSGLGYQLQSTNGSTFQVGQNSALSPVVANLHRVESVLQFAATHPGLGLGHAIDLAFEQDRSMPSSRVMVD